MLALGFDGRYRLMEGGKTQLDVIRERLEQMIRAQRTPVERALSPHWQPAPRERKRLLQFVPLWVALALAAFVLVTASLVLSFRINDFSDPVFASMRSIRVAPAPVLASKVDAAPEACRHAGRFPRAEIAQGLVTVGDSADRTTVTINNTATGTQLFASGSADLDPHFAPADAAHRRRIAGQTGQRGRDRATHDNQRIISARFPSNVALFAGARRYRARDHRGAYRFAIAPERGRTGRHRADRTKRYPRGPREKSSRRHCDSFARSRVMKWFERIQKAGGHVVSRRDGAGVHCVVRRTVACVQRQRAARKCDQPMDP